MSLVKDLGLKPLTGLAGLVKPLVKPAEPTSSVLDIMFVVDATGSMNAFIDLARREIVAVLKEAGHGLGLRACLTFYKDHADTSVAQCYGFSNAQSFEQRLARLATMGGDDTCEAVLDGLALADSVKWLAPTRLLYLVGDAPAHGIETGSCTDDYPQGCPCGLTLPGVAERILRLKVRFQAIALNPQAGACFTQIALACNGKARTFSEAKKAVREYIVPELREAIKTLRLGTGKSNG